MNGTGILAATIHPDLGEMWHEAGARVVASAERVELALAEMEPRGVFVSQDLPGLTPDRLQRWSADRPGRVALWLEAEPPPGWQAASEVVYCWVGTLPAEALEEWLQHLAAPAGFGHGLGVHLLLDTDPHRPALDRFTRWATRLAARHGPGLTVDADWTTARLTNCLLPKAWTRASLAGDALVLPWRLGAFWAAPPPWEVLPPPPSGETVDGAVQSFPAWTLVYLGADVRWTLAARWLARGLDLVWTTGGSRHYVEELDQVIREMAPDLVIGVDGPVRLRDAVAIPATWPDTEDRMGLAVEQRKPSGRARMQSGDRVDGGKREGGWMPWRRRSERPSDRSERRSPGSPP